MIYFEDIAVFGLLLIFCHGGLWELVMDREAAVHRVAKNQTWLRYWTELNYLEPQNITLLGMKIINDMNLEITSSWID